MTVFMNFMTACNFVSAYIKVHNDVPALVLKMAAPELATPLARLFQIFFLTKIICQLSGSVHMPSHATRRAVNTHLTTTGPSPCFLLCQR